MFVVFARLFVCACVCLCACACAYIFLFGCWIDWLLGRLVGMLVLGALVCSLVAWLFAELRAC